VLHQVGVSFDLYFDARKHKITIPNIGLEPGLVADVGYKLLVIAHFIALLLGLWWSEVWQEEYLHEVTTKERR